MRTGLAGRSFALHQRDNPVERARHRLDRARGHPGVDRGGVDLGVAEQNLDDTNIDILLEKMGGKGSPERLPWQVVEGLWHSVCGPTRLRMTATSTGSSTARQGGPTNALHSHAARRFTPLLARPLLLSVLTQRDRGRNVASILLSEAVVSNRLTMQFDARSEVFWDDVVWTRPDV